MFTRMDHVALSVRDMDKVVAFYRDVIGFEKVFDRTFDEPMARLIGQPGTRVRIVHMRFGDAVLELFDYAHPQGRPRRSDHRQSDYGLTHIGFMVEEFWATYDHLKVQGIEFVGEAVEIRSGVFVAYFYGPEGEVCEMREILS